MKVPDYIFNLGYAIIGFALFWIFISNNQKAQYRALYYRRKVLMFFGFCPRCKSRLNYTSKGRGICSNPDCK